eukprot:6197661-Pleurochrysis_carterae.AAC.1
MELEGGDGDGGAAAPASTGLQMPQRLVRRLEKRQGRRSREALVPEPESAPADIAATNDAFDEWGAEREAQDYGEMLETLREIAAQPVAAAASPEREAVEYAGKTQPATPAMAADDDDDDDESDPAHEHEQDLLAAGMMSGIEDATEQELNKMGAEPSMGTIKEMLCAQLGDKVFAEAHKRLQHVAVEEDDDRLVEDIQAILGPSKLDKLPMMLKYIFLEEQQNV